MALLATNHPIDATLDIPSSPLELVFQPPEGFTYNWKRMFIDYETPDIENIGRMVMAGWKPVPWHRHSDLLGSNHGSYWIEHGGLVLMQKRSEDTTKPRAHPTPWEDAMTPTGEFEYVHKIVIKE